MNLYPNDLGEWVNLTLRQERSCTLSVPEQSIHPTTAAVLAAVCLASAVIFWQFSLWPLVDLMGFGAVSFSVWWAKLTSFSKESDEDYLRRPLSDYEIQMARAKAKDALVQSYLDLALSVVKLPATKDETADREVRDATTALGTALESLPPEQPVVTDDPAALRAEAQAQVENAQTEDDAVIAASRRRRAESLLRRADTSARTLLLLRRNKALREEVGEQIQALGTSLTALQVGGRQSTPELSGLAASIHRVALEANAVTVARAEVDTLLSQPHTLAAAVEPQEVRLSVGG